MTVYVDDMLREAAVRNGDHTIRGLWSHLMADTTNELLDFGDHLGLHRAWLQRPASPMEHFDITAGKRLRALELGAVQITYGEGGHLTRAKRAGVTFDLQLLRTDPRSFEATIALPAQHPTSTSPVRVRLSRRAGFALPANTVSVATPTRWANPFRPAARTPEANQAAVEHFTAYLRRNPALVAQAAEELHGRNLACWCAPHLSCHADIWLALVNPTTPTAVAGQSHG